MLSRIFWLYVSSCSTIPAPSITYVAPLWNYLKSISCHKLCYKPLLLTLIDRNMLFSFFGWLKYILIYGLFTISLASNTKIITEAVFNHHAYSLKKCMY